MSNSRSYITVLVGEDCWAVQTSSVEEIVPVYNFYEPAKGLPDYVIGVINYRGNIINLIDTKGFLTGEKNDLKITDKILIVRNYKASFGILVNDVKDIINVNQSATSSYFTHLDNTYRIIDLERILL
jgi:purine-binding chemotaxis protein CheW